MSQGQGQLIGSRVDTITQRQYLLDVTDEGAIIVSGTLNINNISGNITIGSVSANVDSIFVQSGTMFISSGNMYMVSGNSAVTQTTTPWIIGGSIVGRDVIPTDTSQNNPAWSLVYDSNGNLGSVYQMIGTGSYVNIITWIGYSGLLPGVGSRVTNISNWSVV